MPDQIECVGGGPADGKFIEYKNLHSGPTEFSYLYLSEWHIYNFESGKYVYKGVRK